MSKFCTQCGSAVEDNATFCSNCGNAIAAQQSEAQPAYQAPQQPACQPPYQQAAYQQPAYQQPVYQQPAYQQPVYQVAPQERGNGAGTAGMVLGIIAVVFGVIGLFFSGSYVTMAVALFFWIVAGILMLPGIGLSLGGSFGNKPKGRAVAGLILNGLVLFLWIYIFSVIDSLAYYL